MTTSRYWLPLVLAALAVVLIASTSSAALSITDRPDHADMLYDPATGNVQLDTTDSVSITNFFFFRPETS